MNDQQIAEIVSRVVTRLREKCVAEDGERSALPPKADCWRRTRTSDGDRPIIHGRRHQRNGASAVTTLSVPQSHTKSVNTGDGLYDDVEKGLQAAARAHAELRCLGFNGRFKLVEAFRKAALDNLERWSREAVAETGMGRIEDKIVKNRLVTLKTPGPEFLQRPETFQGNDGLTTTRLDPFGVIASIIPCTNSTETIINNGIGMIASGNAVVFNPHPIAKRVSADAVRTINQAISAAGGPRELLCCIIDPTIESANALMRHPLANLVLVTGGGAVVDAAMKSGKRAICAGPGNPPAVVDETADLENAARAIVAGASLDNNVVCTDEKEAIAVASIADKLKELMLKIGCIEVSGREADKLTELILHEKGGPNRHGAPNKKFVGKNPSVILREIGIDVDERVRLVLLDVDKDHPLVWTEQLMPVFPLCRVPDADAAVEHAIAVEAGRRHTASIHSRRLDRITEFSNRIGCSICVANDSNYAGLAENGEGYTSFSIATPTGEGMTTARTFCRERRLALCAGGLRRT